MRRIRIVLTLVIGLMYSLVLVSKPVFASANSVYVSREDVMLVPAPVMRDMEVIWAAKVTNRSDYSQNVVLELPGGAQAVQLEGGGKASFQRSGSRVTLTGAVGPQGTTTLTVTFKLPFDASAGGADMTIGTPLPVDQARIYVPEGGFSPSADGLQVATQTVVISGTRFRVFTRLGIPAGTAWNIRLLGMPGLTSRPVLTGLPVIGQSQGGTGDIVQAVMNLAVAAVILAVALSGMRGPKVGTGHATKEEALLDAWVKLERQARRGLLDKERYQKARADIKEKLIQARLNEYKG